MRKTGEHIDPEKTRTAVEHAVGDVRRAAKPERTTVRELFSWAVALAAGATVAWRSMHEARAGGQLQEAPPLGLDAGSTNVTPEGAAGKGGVQRLKSDPSGRDGKGGGPAGDQPKRPDGKSRGKAGGDPGAERADSAGACGKKAQGPAALAKELWCRYQTAECMTRSQALAFIGVMSLGPVLLFALAALGFVIHDTAQVARFVHDLVAQLLPGRQASQAANSLIAQTHILESAQTLMKGKWWAVTIGLISLLWAAVGLFVGASDPMNVSWNVKETRGFVKLRLVALGVFLGAGILFLLSLIPSSLPSLVGRMHLPFLNTVPPGTWWLEVVGWLLAIVVDAAMFTVIYKFLPNAKVTWKSALFGGVVAGTLWELFKKGFAVYIAHFGNFDKLYGALGGAVLLVTWIWYSCLLLLVGAIICKMYKEHAQDGGVTITPPPSRDNVK